MSIKHIAIFIAAILIPTYVFSAEPYSTQPAYDPVPGEFGAGRGGQLVPLPPTLPEYLPNGAVNLDEAWTQDGGARLYWNTVIIPRELKMAGAYWIDPALVPQLTIQKQYPVKRRYYRRRVTQTTKAPKNAASTALKAPAIPLPVTPTETSTIPPLTAAQAAPANSREIIQQPVTSPASQENRSITPPPLQ